MDQKGATIIEVLAALTLFSLILFVALAFSLRGYSFWDRDEAQIDLQREARKAMMQISDEMRQAARIDGIGESGVSFVLPDGRPVQYFLDASTNSIRRISGGDSRVVATNVGSLNFAQAGPRLISFDVESMERKGCKVHLHMTVFLRWTD